MEHSLFLCLAVTQLGMPRADFACEMMDLVVQESAKYDVEPELIISLIKRESNWKKNLHHGFRNRYGGCGLMQVVPAFTGLKKTGTTKSTCRQLFDPKYNIQQGMMHFNFWLNKWAKGRTKQGLCSYLKGYTCKRRKMPKAGISYANSILRYSKKIKLTVKKILKEGSGCGTP